MTEQLIDRSVTSAVNQKHNKHLGFTKTLFPQLRRQTVWIFFAVIIFHVALFLLSGQAAAALAGFQVVITTLCLCLAMFGIYRATDISTSAAGEPNIALTIGFAFLLALALTIAESQFVQFSQNRLIERGIYYFLLLSVSGAIFAMLAQNEARKQAMVKAEELESLARISQLKALRYQLNPHFIFNALNSVSSLVIDERNADAERLVDALSDYLRTVLDEDTATMVPLTSEIEQHRRYLEIEKVRFPERLSFDIEVSSEASAWKIPALILQPLVENAIKHGVARQSNPVHIGIKAYEENGRLKILVSNTGRLQRTWGDSGKDGMGLENIRARLQALYGDAAALEIGNAQNDHVIAALTLAKETYLFPDAAI